MAKIDMYDLYKPLRNYIRTLDLQTFLELIHKVQQGQQDSVEIKVRNVSTNKVFEIFRWELHLLAREALLHASLGGDKKKSDEKDLLRLVNDVRRISDGVSQKTVDSRTSALRALHPLGHQQIRWQHNREWDRFYRAYRIYSRDDIHPLLYSVLGVRLTTIFTLTFAIVGGAWKSPRILASNYCQLPDISAEECDAYFTMVGASRLSLHESIKKSAQYNEQWAFTWNPLEATPLIQLRPHRPQEYLCPLPELLMRRATDSLFFDLAKSNEEYGNAYGKAFQDYVGNVLRAQFKGEMHRVIEEQEYWVTKGIRKDGVDWIVSDTTGHIMLECKTRRIRVDAKAVVTGAPLIKAIEDLAQTVVQHYKNINDALQGKASWKPDGKPVYPIVVTWEDWCLLAPHVVDMLQSQVRERLGEINLVELLESSPFLITSIAEFEQAGQAIAKIGIDRYCSSLGKLPHRHFRLNMYAPHAFPDIKVEYQRLFPNSSEMFEHLAHLIDLPGTYEDEERRMV